MDEIEIVSYSLFEEIAILKDNNDKNKTSIDLPDELGSFTMYFDYLDP